MSDDLVSRLRAPSFTVPAELSAQDKLMALIRGLEALCAESATALEEARAEIEAANYAHARMRDRAHAAESELSTLRARVREVVGRIVAIENKEYGGDYDEIEEAREIARQLMEEVK